MRTFDLILMTLIGIELENKRQGVGIRVRKRKN